MYSFKLIEYRQLLHHLGQLVPKGNYACCMWVGVACCLILCMLGILHAFCHMLTFCQNQQFEKINSGIPSERQALPILTWTDIVSGLIWIQLIVWNDHQQTTLAGKVLMSLLINAKEKQYL